MDFRSWCKTYFPGGTFSDGGDQYSCRNHYRDEKNASLSFCNSRRAWNDFGQSEGGKISEFCREHGLPEWDGAPEHREERKPLPAPNDRASEARRLWEQGDPVGNHPYLARKGIDGQGCRVTGDGTLLVPAYTLSGGDVVGVERIDAAGSKKHLGTKGGAFFPCGDVKDGKTVLIAEGFATAKSMHAITGFPTLAAFGAVNLLGAAQSLRGREVLICPDADDAGRKTAAQCRSAGFKVVELPPESRNGLDWNDVHVEQGLEPAKALFRDRWAVAQAERVEASVPKKKGIETISARDLRLSLLKAPEWAVEGLIPEGITILAGRPKGGKSWLILQACLAVASGQDFLGHKTTKGKVLYATLEDTNYRLKSRIGKLWDDDRTVPADLLATTDIPRLNPEGIKILEEWIKANNPRMVVLDTWAKSKDAGDKRLNAYEQDVRLVSSIKRLADQYHLCLVLIHHLNKLKVGDENWLESLSGSMGLSGTADAILSLKRDMGQDNAILKRTGRDFENTDDLALVWTLEGWVNNGPAKGKTLTEERQEIIRSIVAAGEPVSPSYIADVLGKKPGSVRVMLHKMVQTGLISRTSNNRYQLPPPKEEKEEVFLESGNSGNTDNGSNADNGGNAGNGSNYDGVTGALSGGGNAVQTSDSKVLTGSVTGVTGVTTSGKAVYNPSDGEPRQGNLEPYFPGGLVTGLSISRGGPSIEDLASRAGVSQAAVQEELDRWKKCGRVSLDGDGTIHLLAGTSYPGQDEPEPPEDEDVGQPEPLSLDALEAWAASFPGMTARLKARAKREKVPYETVLRREYISSRQGDPGSIPDHIPDAGKKVLPGQAALQLDEEPTPPTAPPALKDETPSTPRGEDRSGPPPRWLEAQAEEVRNWHAATLKRLSIIGVPNHEEAALCQAWEKFGGGRR